MRGTRSRWEIEVQPVGCYMFNGSEWGHGQRWQVTAFMSDRNVADEWEFPTEADAVVFAARLRQK